MHKTLLSKIGEQLITVAVTIVVLGILTGAWRLLKDGGLINVLGGVSRSEMEKIYQNVLKGAVIAFDQREGCPDGWIMFSAAENRTIIGASEDGHHFGSTNGQENILLIEDHIPLHLHTYEDIYFSEFEDWRPNGASAVEVPGGLGLAGHVDADNAGWTLPRRTDPVGSEPNKPFTNMQPYIALYYCKRPLYTTKDIK